jgi:hypothetical protein
MYKSLKFHPCSTVLLFTRFNNMWPAEVTQPRASVVTSLQVQDDSTVNFQLKPSRNNPLNGFRTYKEGLRLSSEGYWAVRYPTCTCRGGVPQTEAASPSPDFNTRKCFLSIGVITVSIMYACWHQSCSSRGQNCCRQRFGRAFHS